MIENQNIRQILAIMATDIPDYTETMNNNEEKAWEYLKKQRTIIPPTVSKMNGQTFKEMGDGTFSKFRSAIDAVQCALKIKEEANTNNLPIRIAVHLGEVMDDGVDVIGTGVNIASRIQELANPGGIVISDDVWRQIRNQSEMEGKSIGAQDIRGYHQKVEVFELTYNPDGSITKKMKVTETVTVTDEEGKEVQTESAKKEFIKKIAIFPFDLNNEDKNIEYMKYGIPFASCISLVQDPLIEVEYPNELDLMGGSFIKKLRIAGYEEGNNVPLPLKKKIAKELHCEYFLTGNVVYGEDTINIVSKVYNTKNGKLLNENNLSNNSVFLLIDELSVNIRKNIGIPQLHIDEVENLSIMEILTNSIPAFINFIKGISQYQNNNDYDKAFKYFRDATNLDSTFSLANSNLFWSGFLSNNKDYKEDTDSAINSAISHIYKLPPRLSFVIKIYNFMIHRGDHEKAIKVVEMWIKQFPESIAPYKMLGFLYSRSNRREEAIKKYEEILVKYPDDYSLYMSIQSLYAQIGDYDKALEYAKKYMENCPTEALSYITIGDIYSNKGDEQEAKDYYEQGLMIESDNSSYMVKIAQTEKSLGNFDECEVQFEEALTFCRTNQDFSNVYLSLSSYYWLRGKINKRIIYFKKALEYSEKYINPIDIVLTRIMNVTDYVDIGQKEKAINIIEEGTASLAPPFNLLAGAANIFIGEALENMDLISSGVESAKNFLKEKELPWIKSLPDLGRATILLYKEKKYDEAIKLFNELIYLEPDHKYQFTVRLIDAYNFKKDYNMAIKVGRDYLVHTPMSPHVILGIANAYKLNNEIDKSKEYISKLLGIWEDADKEYISYQKAKNIWKELNSEGVIKI